MVPKLSYRCIWKIQPNPVSIVDLSYLGVKYFKLLDVRGEKDYCYGIIGHGLYCYLDFKLPNAYFLCKPVPW